METAGRGRGKCGCTDIVMAVSVLSAHLHMADRVAKVLQMLGNVTLARQELTRETQQDLTTRLDRITQTYHNVHEDHTSLLLP